VRYHSSKTKHNLHLILPYKIVGAIERIDVIDEARNIAYWKNHIKMSQIILYRKDVT